MEKIVISGIVGAMYIGAFTLFKSVSQSKRFTRFQRITLLILIIFPPLFFTIYIGLLIFNNIKHEYKPEIKQSRQSSNKINELENAKYQLQYLKNSELLTEEEFFTKSKEIEDDISFENIKNTEEYRSLKQLLNNKILTEKEFENKLELLKENSLKRQFDNISNTQFNVIDGFSEGYAKVINDNMEYGFINESNNLIIPFLYDFTENFSESLALMMLNGKFGYIDKNNTIIIPPKFDSAESFYNNKAKVEIDGSKYFIDKIGNKI